MSMRTLVSWPAPRDRRRAVATALGWLMVVSYSPAGGQTGVAPATRPPVTGESLPAHRRPGDWPGFRGPGGNGHAIQSSPPAQWNGKDGTNILWKTAITRHGMSSPVVSGDRLFLTAADEEVRQVLCHDTSTGKLLWHHDVAGLPGFPGQALPDVLDETGFAAPTPVTNGRSVVAIFATGELVCVDREGKRIWARHLGIPKNHYGHASSLISDGTLVFVQYDQKSGQKLMAFELASGKPAWEAKRRAISWSSPILVDNRGRMELILTDSEGVDGYNPKTGTHLWRVDCLAGEVASSAAYADGLVFVGSEGATAAAIEIGKHLAEPKILWRWDETLPDAASLLAGRNLLVVPTGFGVVTCLDAKSGKVHWEHEFDKGFNSSPILVDDRVYIIDLSGTMQVFKMAAGFELLGQADLGEPAYATPAFVGSRIYIRGLNHLFCIEKQK